jgi:hypothetical protein
MNLISANETDPAHCKPEYSEGFWLLCSRNNLFFTFQYVNEHGLYNIFPLEFISIFTVLNSISQFPIFRIYRRNDSGQLLQQMGYSGMRVFAALGQRTAVVYNCCNQQFAFISRERAFSPVATRDHHIQMNNGFQAIDSHGFRALPEIAFILFLKFLSGGTKYKIISNGKSIENQNGCLLMQ